MKTAHKMTDLEKRIKIAEHCGWKYAGWHMNGLDWKRPDGVLCNGVPDYLNDLNAMHEVENVFIKEDGCVWGPDWELYCDNLAKICFMADPVNCLARATAAQRAEAFLQTIGAYE